MIEISIGTGIDIVGNGRRGKKKGGGGGWGRPTEGGRVVREILVLAPAPWGGRGFMTLHAAGSTFSSSYCIYIDIIVYTEYTVCVI